MHRLISYARKSPWTFFALILLSLVFIMGADDCSGKDEAQKQRDKSVDKRAAIYARAEKKFPVPNQTNFPLREALVKMTEREDLPNHPWYVYLIADTGNTIGYYVAQHSPVNSCAFLSSTEDYDNGVILTAPSVDGIYYGGGGASANCDSWFFFDAATDAMVRIRGMDFYVSEAPLNLDAKAIKVAKSK